MKTNNDIRTDEQLWTEVLEVLHDNRRELTDEEVKMLVKEDSLHSLYHKIAAIFLAAAFLGGLAWAISPLLTSPKGKEPQTSEVTSTPLTLGGGREGASSLIRFSDIRLESILTVVSAHYGKTVCFRDTTTQSLRLNTVWDSEDSLAVFIETLNEFDELRLSDERDTIFVESVKEEDKG